MKNYIVKKFERRHFPIQINKEINRTKEMDKESREEQLNEIWAGMEKELNHLVYELEIMRLEEHLGEYWKTNWVNKALAFREAGKKIDRINKLGFVMFGEENFFDRMLETRRLKNE
tara:strand:- start:77 stop:424 length:348 start_codon:yes stop_codon:yes gene_type:complete